MIWQKKVDEKDIWLVGVIGRLDHQVTPELEEHLANLLQEGHSQLIVDLSQVNYINSGGLRSLVTAWRQAREADGKVVLCGLSERLSELFQMVGFDNVFQIYDTSTEALTHMDG